MRFEPLKRIDKTGCEVVLRNAKTEDAESLLQYLKTIAMETPYLIREPDEITLSLEQEQNFIQRMIDAERELMLVAMIDGKHVGNCSLMQIGPQRRYCHRCSIAIALYQEYCGRGIGKMMMETILETARQTGYEQAELEVIAKNETAIALYEQCGFQKYGHFPDNMKYADKTYADAYWMMRKL